MADSPGDTHAIFVISETADDVWDALDAEKLGPQLIDIRRLIQDSIRFLVLMMRDLYFNIREKLVQLNVAKWHCRNNYVLAFEYSVIGDDSVCVLVFGDRIYSCIKVGPSVWSGIFKKLLR